MPVITSTPVLNIRKSSEISGLIGGAVLPFSTVETGPKSICKMLIEKSVSIDGVTPSLDVVGIVKILSLDQVSANA
jgi:hypothetical protein